MQYDEIHIRFEYFSGPERFSVELNFPKKRIFSLFEAVSAIELNYAKWFRRIHDAQV